MLISKKKLIALSQYGQMVRYNGTRAATTFKNLNSDNWCVYFNKTIKKKVVSSNYSLQFICYFNIHLVEMVPLISVLLEFEEYKRINW